VKDTAVWLWMQVSGRTDDRLQVYDMLPLQSEVIFMADSAAQYAKYVAVVFQYHDRSCNMVYWRLRTGDAIDGATPFSLKFGNGSKKDKGSG